MSTDQVLAIVIFLLVLAGAAVAVYAAMKRRPRLMLVALGFMQVPLGIQNLHHDPRWIADFELAVAALLLVLALIYPRLQRSAQNPN